MNPRWLVASLLLLTSLSGCTSPGATDAPEEPAALDATGDGNATVEQNVTLDAPVPRIVLDANGTAPLLVNITLEADGNVTAWTLDLGDGNTTEGDALPATLNHTYLAGNHTLTFQVTGPGGNATATQALNVTASVGAPAALAPFEATVAVDLPCLACGDAGTLTCVWRTAGATPADCAWIDFPDELAGQPFTLTGTGLDPDVLFWNDCDDGPSTKFNSLMAGESGIVPDGAGCALVWEQFDFLVSVTLRIEPA